MKRIFALAGLLCMAFLLPARAEGPDDQYFKIYMMIQEGDSLKDAGETSRALARYQQARTALQQLHDSYPNWNNQLVDSRLNGVAEEIDKLATNQSRTNAPSQAVPQPGGAPRTLAVPSQAGLSALQVQIQTLQQQLQQMQTDKTLLESKLKEALSAQPASADPREFARAQEQMRSLQKENELLKVNLDRPQAPATPPVDSGSLDKLKKDLADANQKLAQQTDLATKLARENETLQSRPNNSDAAGMAALRSENELLKKQIAESKNTAPPSDASDLKRQLAETQAQVAALRSQQEASALEKTLLQEKVRQLSTSPAPTTIVSTNIPAEDSSRIKRLERERDDLQKKLDAAQRELAKKGKSAGRGPEVLAGDTEVLRTRLAVLEAQAVPYSAEELALLKSPQQTIQTNANAGKKSVKELPPGAAKLVAEAQRDFAARNFSQAEAKYLQVLKQDDKNVNTLANLATIQMEMGHFDDAEKNLKTALTVDPTDAYSLSVLGNLKFRQEKYDEALDVLSRAARLDPQNPEVQNYLGLTLSQKGMRTAAETALRKAIQLNPNYASAHNNLAVIYVTQKPPAVELARWHYQKALAAGLPRNPDLEKMLDENKAAASAQ